MLIFKSHVIVIIIIIIIIIIISFFKVKGNCFFNIDAFANIEIWN